MADWGIKVTKEGKAISSTTPEDYVLNSKYSTVKIFKQGSGTVSVSEGSSNTVTISHDLGFIPICFAYTENEPGDGNWYFGADTILSHPEDASLVITGTYVDDEDLILSFTNDAGTGNKTLSYYYFIFADDGA